LKSLALRASSSFFSPIQALAGAPLATLAANRFEVARA